MGAWLRSVWESLTTQTATWFVGVVILLLGVFSDRIVESVKFALNRADLRTQQYETLSTELSRYAFSAELLEEFLREGWTTGPTLRALVTEYNEAITSLRRREYVHLAWLDRYWGEAEVEEFQELMAVVRQVDGAIHRLNDEFEAVNIRGTQERVDAEKAKPVIEAIGPLVGQLQERTQGFLSGLY